MTRKKEREMLKHLIVSRTKAADKVRCLKNKIERKATLNLDRLEYEKNKAIEEWVKYDDAIWGISVYILDRETKNITLTPLSEKMMLLLNVEALQKLYDGKTVENDEEIISIEFSLLENFISE